MEDNHYYLCVWAIVGIIVVSCIAIGCYSSYKQSQLFVEGKYVSCVLPGSSSTQWCR
jgi:hypothetical protein